MATDLALVEARLRKLEVICAEAGIAIVDGFISEAGAARLLNLAHGSLRHQRRAHRAPRHFKGIAGFRVCYEVRDIAEFIERRAYE